LAPRIYDDIPREPLPQPGRALSIGVYDGVHLGHQAVIRKAAEEAAAREVPLALLTFDRLPEELLRPEVAPKRLMDLPEKIEALSRLGPDEIIVARVKPELLGQTPGEFVARALCEILRPSVVVIGEDFRYGKGGKGNAATLKADAGACGCETLTVAPVRLDGEKASSTRIRRLLMEGDPEGAARLLTRPYRLTGTVVYGRQQGRLLGFPTANLEIDPLRQSVGRGVYACRAFGNGLEADAAVNVGVRPTFDDGDKISVEAHLIDFEGDLYGRDLSLEFISRLREERKFPSLDALKRQLGEDIEAARTRLRR
jgi:riboflavin kinase/FMN adenylyltransferase